MLPWSHVFFPQVFIPRQRFDLAVTWDEGRDAPVVRSDHTGVPCKEVAPRRILCGSRRIPAHRTDPEVTYVDVLPSIVVAEPTTWANLAATYGDIIRGTFSDHGTMQFQLGRLLSGAGTDREKLARLHGFVAREIRYVGLEHGTGGIVPRPTRTTLQRRYGDCKDKTALFINLAELAGFTAYPVLTSSDRQAVDRLAVPAHTYFDHVVACVSLPTDGEICVDLTDPYSSLADSARVLEGAVRLDLHGSSGAPRLFARRNPERQRRVDTWTSMTADGVIKETQVISMIGETASRTRAGLVGLNTTQRQRRLLDFYHSGYADGIDPTFTVDGLDNVDKRLSIRVKATFANSFDPNAITHFRDLEGWLSNELDVARAENKHHAYRFGGSDFVGVTHIEVPPGRQPEFTGAQLDFNSPFGFLRRSYTSFGRKVQVDTHLSLPAQVIPVGRMAEFNAFLKALKENAAIWFSMKKKDDS